MNTALGSHRSEEEERHLERGPGNAPPSPPPAPAQQEEERHEHHEEMVFDPSEMISV
jgi:hypothetical protein